MSSELSPFKGNDICAEDDSQEVKTIVSKLISGQNVFVTGPGGVGKSFLIKRVFSILTNAGYITYKSGSTGVSAENIGGMTFHSFSGIGLGDKEAETYYLSIRERNKKAFKRWISSNFLIIDEISMIGGKLFTMTEKLARLLRRNNAPFGGLVLLLCGDMCQLPPVKDEYIFKSKAFLDLNLEVVRLTKPWRFQKDIDFFYLLSRARLGECTDEDIKKLEQRKISYYKEIYNKELKKEDIKPTKLFSKKIDVSAMNMQELNALPDETFDYKAFDDFKKKTKTASGDKQPYQELMDKNVPVNVSLKVGAQVMLTWNLDVENSLCNGSRGVVTRCEEEYVTVKFKHIEINVFPNTWVMEDEDCIFSRTQMPLILAWALTIHKIQSATLDSVIVDLGTSIFSPNMAYVALSRCRSLDGIYLNNLMPEKIYCHPDAKEFEYSLLEGSYGKVSRGPLGGKPLDDSEIILEEVLEEF